MSVATVWMVATTLLLAGMAVMVRVNRRRAPRLEQAPAVLGRPRVSLLVPARNEADNLRRNLPAWLEQDWPELEILVLDDESTDDTAAVLESFRLAHPDRLRILGGASLPAGWLGKNWACQQLAEAAGGEVLLFVDADVDARPDAVRRSLGWLQAAGAGAVTVLPRQRTGSWAEDALVPGVMHLPILGLLPLWRTAGSLDPATVVANGQWLMLRREAWQEAGGHAAVRGEVVEDMALGRRLRAAGWRVWPLLAPAAVHVRMYAGGRAVWEGFAKNLAGLFGWRSGAIVAALAVWSVLFVLPWLLLPFAPMAALPALLATIWLRAEIAGLRLAPRRAAWLHPVAAFLLPLLLLDSWRRMHGGRVAWKGRRLPAMGAGRRARTFLKPTAARSEAP